MSSAFSSVSSLISESDCIGTGASVRTTKSFDAIAAGKFIFCSFLLLPGTDAICEFSDADKLRDVRAKISRAVSASSSAATKRRWALSNLFFARRSFSLTTSICASVFNIFDADCFVGSRPTCFFCWLSFDFNCFNRTRNSAIESFVRIIVSRALAAFDSAIANRSDAAR